MRCNDTLNNKIKLFVAHSTLRYQKIYQINSCKSTHKPKAPSPPNPPPHTASANTAGTSSSTAIDSGDVKYTVKNPRIPSIWLDCLDNTSSNTVGDTASEERLGVVLECRRGNIWEAWPSCFMKPSVVAFYIGECSHSLFVRVDKIAYSYDFKIVNK